MASPSLKIDPNLFNADLYRQILKLWFSDIPLPTSSVTFAQSGRWWGVLPPDAKAAFDKECYDISHETLQSIGPNKFALPPPDYDATIGASFAPLLTPTEQPGPDEIALSLMILLDQLPRNCFRTDQGVIYSHYDRISRALVREIRSRGLDTSERYRDSPPWLLFFYMPLMHSELLEDHKTFQSILAAMKRRAEEKDDAAAAADFTNNALLFLKKHTDIVERYGRYPYRNEYMGRETTPEEKEWIDNGGERFSA